MIREEGLVPSIEVITFMTKSGDLCATREGDTFEMSFPARQVQPAANNEELDRSLRIAPIFTGRYAVPKGDLYLLEADSEASLRAITPDHQRLISAPARAVIVTSRPSEQLTGYQASERTGIVQCRWAENRVWLGGRAVTVFRAHLLV